MNELKFVCFGEVLWDVFPSHKKIGGAPLNVAIRLNSFGNDVFIVSKIGKDELGKLLVKFVNEKGLDDQNIQIDSNLKTGEVEVVLDEKGSASYSIMYPRAWDQIVMKDKLKHLVISSDVFIFGSLICRNNVSRDTLEKLLGHAKFKVFDVNLRAPFYNHEVLFGLMKKANFIKFNEEELSEICKYHESGYTTIEENIFYISKKTNTDHVCVTKGENGAVLYCANKFFYNDGFYNDFEDFGEDDDYFYYKSKRNKKILEEKDRLHE